MKDLSMHIMDILQNSTRAGATNRITSYNVCYTKLLREEDAKAKQEEHREASSREGVVREFMDRKVPEDWSKWPLDKRRIFWAGGVQGDIRLVVRDRICRNNFV